MENNVSKSGNLGIKALKVYKKYFNRFGYYIVLPEIRLSGKWLQNSGFTFGESIKVRTEKNMLIITNLDKVIIVL